MVGLVVLTAFYGGLTIILAEVDTFNHQVWAFIMTSVITYIIAEFAMEWILRRYDESLFPKNFFARCLAVFLGVIAVSEIGLGLIDIIVFRFGDPITQKSFSLLWPEILVGLLLFETEHIYPNSLRSLFAPRAKRPSSSGRGKTRVSPK